VEAINSRFLTACVFFALATAQGKFAYAAPSWSAEMKINSVQADVDGSYIVDFGANLPAVCAYPSVFGDSSTVGIISLTSTERNYPNMVDGNKNLISTALAAFAAGKLVKIYYEYGVQPCRIYRIRAK